MLNVIILSVVILSVLMLNAIIPSVFMLSVVAPMDMFSHSSMSLIASIRRR